MKNIAFMTPDLKSGGSERVATRLSNLLSDKYNVYYIVYSDEDISYKVNCELINLKVPSTPIKLKRYFNIILRTAKLRRVCRKKKIDILFSFTDNANTTMRLSGLKCRQIGSCRGFDDLKLNTVNYHKVVSAGGEILFNAKEMEEFYREKYPQDADKLHTIENLFDCMTIESRSRDTLSEEEQKFFDTHKVVTTCGIFSRHKGHWDLFKSFELLKEKVPDAGLVLVGHRGQYEEELKDMAARNKYADDILLVGFSDNPFKYMAKSEAYALSSITEGFPNAMIEAMVCKVPVVATACSTGPNEIAYDEYNFDRPTDKFVEADNCILTPTFDGNPCFDYSKKQKVHEIYADALARVLTDKELACHYAEKGYARAMKNDENEIADKYYEYIERK